VCTQQRWHASPGSQLQPAFDIPTSLCVINCCAQVATAASACAAAAEPHRGDPSCSLRLAAGAAEGRSRRRRPSARSCRCSARWVATGDREFARTRAPAPVDPPGLNSTPTQACHPGPYLVCGPLFVSGYSRNSLPHNTCSSPPPHTGSAPQRRPSVGLPAPRAVASDCRPPRRRPPPAGPGCTRRRSVSQSVGWLVSSSG
jgi:hypothetical protein